MLSGSGGRVRGDVLVANDNEQPVELELEMVESDALPARGSDATAAAPERTRTVLGPSTTTRARLAASIDPLTPPGRYEARVAINGDVHPAVIEVGERVDLALSETELVVFAEPGEQRRRLVATNRGNVPLRVSRLGPITLTWDPPRRSLLSRLGAVTETTRRAGRPPARDPDEPEATVEARLEKAIELAPGEVAALEWIVEVTGPVPPGVRHRATAALYTSDVTFVVTPPQDGPEPRVARKRPAKTRETPTAAGAASRQKPRRKP